MNKKHIIITTILSSMLIFPLLIYYFTADEYISEKSILYKTKNKPKTITKDLFVGEWKSENSSTKTFLITKENSSLILEIFENSKIIESDKNGVFNKTTNNLVFKFNNKQYVFTYNLDSNKTNMKVINSSINSDIIIIIILNLVISVIATLTYSVRIAGINTGKIAISLALFNAIALIILSL